jgi:peptidoglycan/LPS O-acetylase OafA/YrhL
MLARYPSHDFGFGSCFAGLPYAGVCWEIANEPDSHSHDCQGRSMLRYFNSASNPVYAFALLLVVAAASTVLCSIVPFLRREISAEASTRLTPLDGLRGILSFGVMGCHSFLMFEYIGSGVWVTTYSHFYLLLGETSVALFFSTTAFLFWSRAQKLGGRIPAWPFLRGRIFRLVTLYIFCCLATLAAIAPRAHWFSFATVRGLANMAALGMRVWTQVGGVILQPVNGVTWSLQYEWAFYLMLPALASVVRADASKYLWLLFAGAIAIFPDNPVLFFFPGVLAVYACQSASITDWCRSRAASVAMILAGIALPCITGDAWGFVGLLATTIIFVPIACGNTLFGLLTSRGLRLMGIVSYSVYLLHMLALYLGQPLLIHAKNHGTPAYWGCCCLLACAVLIVSLVTYRWIEWPFMQYEKLLRRNPRDSLPKPEISRSDEVPLESPVTAA